MSDETMSRTQVQEVQAAVKAQIVEDGVDFVLVRHDDQEGAIRVVDLDLEKYEDHPRRKTGRAVFYEHSAFSTYVNEHDEGARMWGDARDGRVDAVLNPHKVGDTSPGWADHRAVLDLQATPEWAAWRGLNEGGFVDQQGFAEFLEDHLDDIIDPAGADVLELANTFEAKTDVQFRSAQTLQSGDRELLYSEATAASGGTGSIEIPAKLTLRIPVYLGTDPVEIEARFRYRIREGHLSLGIKLIGVDKLLDEVFRGVAQAIELRTSQAVWLGVPLTRI